MTRDERATARARCEAAIKSAYEQRMICSDLSVVLDALNAADREIERLRDALDRYGEHTVSCKLTSVQGHDAKGWIIYRNGRRSHVAELPSCTCDLDAALAELAGGTEVAE